MKSSLCRIVIAWISALLLAACAPSPRAPGLVHDAMDAFVVWAPVDPKTDTSADGEAVDVVTVRGGDLVRLEVDGDRPVDVAERTLSGGAVVETWAARNPNQGVIVLRAGAFATTILGRPGTFRRAHVGHGSDPGYYWFSLEDAVIEWADGPLGAPFPPVAPRERLDVAAFAELDRVLSDAISRASERNTAETAARSLRRVVALRAIRALRPASGFPYFFDSMPEPASPATKRALREREGYAVSPATPLELAVEGPALLHLWMAPEVVTRDGELIVHEGERERARATLSSPRAPLTPNDHSGAETGARFARRALVHVPPGTHRYRIESSVPALVAPLRAEAVVHAEDTTRKDEGRLLGEARTTCRGPGSPSLCAVALALLGEDRKGLDVPAGELSFAQAMAAAPPEARAVASTLSTSGSQVPGARLQIEAARGSPAALEALSTLRAGSVDDHLRAGWVQAMSRGTEWAVAPAEHEAMTWYSLAHAAAAEACGSDPAAAWPTVTAEEKPFVAERWHGEMAVELLMSASCDDPAPVELSIDGTRVRANPSTSLARLHVRVRGDVAKIRRLDRGSARVFAVPAEGPCAPRWEAIRAPRVARTTPRLDFGRAPSSPGVEVWLRDGRKTAQVVVSGGATGRALRIVARAGSGLAALDDTGRSWTRIARIALPDWAAHGVRIEGDDDVAVRAITRVPRPSRGPPALTEAKPAAVALDEGTLVGASRKISTAARTARGPLYLERALLLAAGGAGAAALSDADLAKHLGAVGPLGEDAVELVRKAIRHRASPSAPLPEGLNAFGIEPDFDDGARRCERGTEGPRGRFERALDDFPAESKDGRSRHYDPTITARALAARDGDLLDPRSGGLAARAFASSRWRLRTDLAPSLPRVRREHSPQRDGVIDPEGELRARVAAGAPFGPGTFAAVVPHHPAEALLSRVPPSAVVRVDLACIARDAEALATECPVEVLVGDAPPLRPTFDADGRGTLTLPKAVGNGAMRITVQFGSGGGRWAALARITVDRAIPGAREVDPGIWVLVPRRLEARYVLKDGGELGLETTSGTVFRVDVTAEDGTTPESVLVVDGRAQPLPADGSAVTVPVLAGERAVVRTTRGTASVAVAERVPVDVEPDASKEDRPMAESVEPASPAHRRLSLDLGGATSDDEPGSGWTEVVTRSPQPLTPLQASLGTVVASVGAVYGTLRQGFPPAPNAEGFAFGIVGYRRRIESIGLWTNFDAFWRERNGEPTRGAALGLYEAIVGLQLRLSVGVSGQEQLAAGVPARLIATNGFVEYSHRVTRDFFVLPRLGYDTVYMSLRSRPTSFTTVDDEIYNPYRKKRPTFLFAQALLWYTPRFDEVFYVRVRSSSDPRGAVFSHVTARPGVFLALGQLDVSAFLEEAWFSASESATRTAHLGETLGTVARWNFWSHLGSLDVQPGMAGFVHPRDGGFQVNVFVNLLASYRRGLRDFSSLELDFPEQFGGGIPWRGATPGGYQ